MRKNLKILVVLPLYGGSLPVGRYCAQALSDLGYFVEIFEAPAHFEGFQAIKELKVRPERLTQLENAYIQLLGNMIFAKVEAFEPDLVLAMAQAPMPLHVLKKFQMQGTKTAMWFVEDHEVLTYWPTFAPYYDIFAIIQKEPFISKLNEIGQKNVLYLPMAAQPTLHKPLALNQQELRQWGSTVSFMGAGYPNRRRAFHKLIHHDLKIWGTEWDEDATLKPYVQLEGRRISSEECVRIFNASKININLHSSVHPERLISKGDFVNPRTFEVAACGAFQLVDKRSLLTEVFEADELSTFTSLQELHEKIDYYLAHPQEREAMAQKAQQRVLAEHTYAHRMQTLLDFTAQQLPDWPQPAADNQFSIEWPENLKNDFEELIERFGLSANISFPDLVSVIRQQTGVLSEFDAAILFLDEWQRAHTE